MIFLEMLGWLFDPTHWGGSDGLVMQLLLHVYYCVVALLFAAAVAVPLGVYIGHTGRGTVLAVAISNAMRALPTLGLVTLLVLLIGLGDLPTLLGLVVLAIPSVLSGTYAGIQGVRADVVDAAKGMGMTGWQQLWRVKLPNALPLIVGGFRSALLQLVATAAVAAYVGLGGLGRVLLDGFKVQDYAQMGAAALLIALLAVVLDLLLGGCSRLLAPRGLRIERRVRITRDTVA